MVRPHSALGVALATAVAAAASAASASLPLPDNPYIELVASRYTCSGSPVIEGWGTVPSADVRQVERVALSDAAGQPADGFLLVTSTSVLLAARPAPRTGADPGLQSGMYLTAPLSWVPVSGLAVPQGARVAVDPVAGSVLAVATSTGVTTVSCALSLAVGPSCKAGPTYSFPVGAVNDLAVSTPSVPAFDLWIASANGLVLFDSTNAAAPFSLLVSNASFAAVAYSAVRDEVAVGNGDRVWYVQASTAVVQRFDWVTVVADGAGGVYDDAVTALAYDEGTGALYVGNPTALNVRYQNGTVDRVNGIQGLPYNNITALAVQRVPNDPATYGLSAGSTWLWVGTLMGVAVADISSTVPAPTSTFADPANLESFAARSGPARQSSPPFAALPIPSWTWRYLYQARWLPGPLVVDIAIADNVSLVLTAPTSAFVDARVPKTTTATTTMTATTATVAPASGYGVSLLEQQPWTLAQKAVRMESIQARHDRVGLVAECTLAAFGNVTGDSCSNDYSDNNGLWTSIIVAAEAARYKATGSPDARALAGHYFRGLELLNVVTGIPGLMARSAVPPNESQPTGYPWHNSSALPGWVWKGTTSSDEVTGHLFAYPAILRLLDWPNATVTRATEEGEGEGEHGHKHEEADDAKESSFSSQRQAVVDAVMAWQRGEVSSPLPTGNVTRTEVVNLIELVVAYIVRNNMTLVDITGQPTEWGHWDPPTLNGLRDWSDGRGVNSNQALSYLAVALDATTSPALQALFNNAYTELTNATNQYDRNTLNLKIIAPDDDNYSDDELTFLPYYAFLTTPSTPTARIAPILASLQRTFHQVQSLRSDLWTAIYLACLQSVPAGVLSPPLDPGVAATLAGDIVWNLQTWPLELIDWPVQNSQRLDVRIDPQPNRDFVVGTESLNLLPANERVQDRWNADPFDLDGGSGYSETDGGVWLLPYWLARAHNLIAPAQ